MNKDTEELNSSIAVNFDLRLHAARGRGGGKGICATVGGDVPECILDIGGETSTRSDTRASRPRDSEGFLYTAIIWNACGLKNCAENDIVDLLEAEGVTWDAVLIQEGLTTEKNGCTTIDKGHALYTGSPGPVNRATCILLHRGWAETKLSFHVQTERVVYLDLDVTPSKVRLTSAYLPHADFPVEVYEAALESLEQVVLGA